MVKRIIQIIIFTCVAIFSAELGRQGVTFDYIHPISYNRKTAEPKGMTRICISNNDRKTNEGIGIRTGGCRTTAVDIAPDDSFLLSIALMAWKDRRNTTMIVENTSFLGGDDVCQFVALSAY
jgi:hypothetical protein